MADETGKDDGAKQGMIDDISSELRDWAFIVDETIGKAHVVMLSGSVFSEAADEIERLRAALAIAAGMISTMPQYEHQHPESVMDMLLEEARRGDR